MLLSFSKEESIALEKKCKFIGNRALYGLLSPVINS